MFNKTRINLGNGNPMRLEQRFHGSPINEQNARTLFSIQIGIFLFKHGASSTSTSPKQERKVREARVDDSMRRVQQGG